MNWQLFGTNLGILRWSANLGILRGSANLGGFIMGINHSKEALAWKKSEY